MFKWCISYSILFPGDVLHTGHEREIILWKNPFFLRDSNKMLGYTLVYRLRLNKNLEYTKYRQKYIESEYISHFGRK